jgi:DNA repair protein RadC
MSEYTVQELFSMIHDKSKSIKTIKLPAEAAAIFVRYQNRKQENFIVASVDSAHAVISVRVITKGLANRTLVHPREIFRNAIIDNAAAIILCHNHPSGNTTPSTEDRDITAILEDAGRILGIEVLDHIIISKNGFYSFQENGDL